MSSVLWNLKVHSHVHTGQPLAPLARQINPANSLQSYVFKTHFNITLPSDNQDVLSNIVRVIDSGLKRPWSMYHRGTRLIYKNLNRHYLGVIFMTVKPKMIDDCISRWDGIFWSNTREFL
jgi:hypothetical protein